MPRIGAAGYTRGMTAALNIPLLTVDEYLAAERASDVKHEYLGGRVYAMAGARTDHNRVVTSLLITLGEALRGNPCEPFNSDMKVRVPMPTHTRFYYPDAMVVCDPSAAGSVFQDRPVLIAEVLSVSTRRTDEGEKCDAYLTIPSLRYYLLIDTDRPRVRVHRRNALGGFDAAMYEQLDGVVPLPELEIELPLGRLYERIDFAAVRAADEAEAEG